MKKENLIRVDHSRYGYLTIKGEPLICKTMLTKFIFEECRKYEKQREELISNFIK